MRISEQNHGVVPLADGLFAVEHHRRALRFHTRHRMDVVVLESRGLLLYSPTPIDDGLGREIDALGAVEHIVAPSRGHHLWAQDAKRRYPAARLWAAPGLREKRPDLTFDGVLDSSTTLPFGAGLEVAFLAGTPAINEVVLFHRASRSLLCCDLLFNVHDEESLSAELLYRALGVFRCVGQSRAWRMWTKDRAAARAAIDEVLQWDIARVVMAHGDVLEGEQVRAQLLEATAWLR